MQPSSVPLQVKLIKTLRILKWRSLTHTPPTHSVHPQHRLHLLSHDILETWNIRKIAYVEVSLHMKRPFVRNMAN